jgi:hypothetical protein
MSTLVIIGVLHRWCATGVLYHQQLVNACDWCTPPPAAADMLHINGITGGALAVVFTGALMHDTGVKVRPFSICRQQV